jgi:HEAT repeat protein
VFTAGCYELPAASQPDVVVAELIRLLRDPAPDVRRTAALSLGKIGRPEAAHALVAQLSDQDPQVRQYSAWALGNLGEDIVDVAGPALVTRLSDRDDDVRTSVAQALGRLGAPPSIKPILEIVLHGDPGARKAAIQALGWLEAPESFPSLIRSLADRDAGIRQAAIAALGELADIRAVPYLAERLRKDPDPGVRSECAFRLGKLGGKSAIRALQAATQDPDPRVRRWARAALESVQENPSQEKT